MTRPYDSPVRGVWHVIGPAILFWIVLGVIIWAVTS